MLNIGLSEMTESNWAIEAVQLQYDRSFGMMYIMKKVTVPQWSLYIKGESWHGTEGVVFMLYRGTWTSVTGKSMMLWCTVVIYLSILKNTDILCHFQILGKNSVEPSVSCQESILISSCFHTFFLVLVYFVKNKLWEAKPINCLLNHLYQSVYFNSYTGSTAHPDLHFEESVLIFWMTERYSRGCKNERVQGANFSCDQGTGSNHKFQIPFSLAF